jgi:tRNA threonylcarbamoyladenosine biosynthesis protein TsaE
VDLYRIETTADLQEIGLYDILQENGVVAIEWANKLPDGLISEGLAIDFEIIDDETRKLSVSASGQIGTNLINLLGLSFEKNCSNP